jgi:DNA polymerase-1
MRTFTTLLGGRPVTVHAPAIGEFAKADAFAMWAALKADGRWVAGLDVETNGIDSKAPTFHWAFQVRTVQFGTTGEAWVLRLDDPYQRSVAATVLADTRLRFCSHTRFDVVAVWRQFGVDISDRWIDTRLLARIANPLTLDRHAKKAGRDAVDLKNLTTHVLGAPELAEWDKKLDQVFEQVWRAGGGKGQFGQAAVRYGFTYVSLDDETYLTYAGLDAIACRRLYPKLISDSASDRVLLATEIWLAGLLVRMQMRGMRVDRGQLQVAYDEADAKCAPPEKVLVEKTGLNPRQGVKLLEWIGDRFTIPATHPKTKTGKSFSLAGDDLDVFYSYEGLPDDVREVVDLLVAYKERINAREKAKEVMALVDESFDGRLHGLVDSLGAITARMSAATPNVQNYNKDDPTMRATLLPDEGHVLIGADFDTVELRVMAALTGEQAFLDTIYAGGDLHQLTADKLGVTRQVAKRVNFLQVYGGGAEELAKQTGLSLDEAKAATNGFRDAYGEIRAFSQAMNGMEQIRTETFRRIPVTQYTRKGGTTAEPAYFRFLNYKIQSAARDLLVLALHRLAEMGLADMLWLPIHDELILQVPENRVDECMAKLQEAMRMNFLGVPITATAVALYDEDGVSRWMTCDRAEKIREAKAEARNSQMAMAA